MEQKKLTKRKEKALNTKSKIYNAAIDLMDRRGFENITIADISKQAGVSVGAFYHYFKSKNDILAEIFKKGDDYFTNEVEENLRKRNVPARILEFFDHYSKFNIETGVDTVQEIYNARVRFFTDKNRPMMQLLDEIIREGQEKKQIRTDMDSKEIVNFLFIAARGIVFDWGIHGGEYDLEFMMHSYMEKIISTCKS